MNRAFGLNGKTNWGKVVRMSPLQKLLLVVHHPHHLLGFTRFQLSRLTHRGRAQVRLQGRVRVGGYRRYSEWQGAKETISPAEYAFLRRLCLREGDILDVGGNVGAFSLVLSTLHAARRIHCFEPVPETFTCLRENLHINGARHVVPVQAAVAGASGEVGFLVFPESSAICRLADGHGESIRVPAWSLDDYCQAHHVEKVALLKVDVEGYEEDVFNGAARLLSSGMLACVYYEVCPELGRILSRDVLAPTRLLERHGYRVFHIGAHGALADLNEAAVRAAKLINLVAATPEFCKSLL
jgi:FkbM family methyltransferase